MPLSPDVAGVNEEAAEGHPAALSACDAASSHRAVRNLDEEREAAAVDGGDEDRQGSNGVLDRPSELRGLLRTRASFVEIEDDVAPEKLDDPIVVSFPAVRLFEHEAEVLPFERAAFVDDARDRKRRILRPVPRRPAHEAFDRGVDLGAQAVVAVVASSSLVVLHHEGPRLLWGRVDRGSQTSPG